MEAVPDIVVIGGMTLAFNVAMHLFGGGWKLSGRMSSIETDVFAVRGNIATMQKTLVAVQGEIRELTGVLVKIADMRGDLKVFDTRLTDAGIRLTETSKDLRMRQSAIEQDFRDLRAGIGWKRGHGGVDGEYGD